MFIQLAEGVDEGAWLHHLARGDYSRWTAEAIKDDELAAEISAIEEGPHRDGSRVARRSSTIRRCYTHPA
jgi:hypothetical protein